MGFEWMGGSIRVKLASTISICVGTISNKLDEKRNKKNRSGRGKRREVGHSGAWVRVTIPVELFFKMSGMITTQLGSILFKTALTIRDNEAVDQAIFDDSFVHLGERGYPIPV